MIEEIWKPIVEYDGLYEVSNLGRIKTKDNIIKKFVYTKDKYFRTSLYKNKKRKSFLVHRLVAQAFIPNPENKPQINHINGIKDDNRVENIEWCTQFENMQHAIKNHLNKPLRGSKHPNSRKTNQYDLNNNFIKQWDTITSASEYYKVCKTCIRDCCIGKQKKSKGFIWKYGDKSD